MLVPAHTTVVVKAHRVVQRRSVAGTGESLPRVWIRCLGRDRNVTWHNSIESSEWRSANCVVTFPAQIMWDSMAASEFSRLKKVPCQAICESTCSGEGRGDKVGDDEHSNCHFVLPIARNCRGRCHWYAPYSRATAEPSAGTT